MNHPYYRATWGWPLTLISIGATAICVTVACAVGSQNVLVGLPIGAALAAMVVACALFTVRGYTVADDALWVHRLLWITRLPMAGLESARFQPNAMRGSLRTWGNGGLFSFSGRYWSRTLGSYRALATDLRRTVVLRIDGKTLVVSPDEPDDFVRQLTAAAGRS